ncbi:MAG: hypothetical protein JJ975_07730 [Bacteroidia bacterium]|nr:hypothetical protein [Bacteroidia bacterium]
MKRNARVAIFLALIFTTLTASAQKYSFENITRKTLRNSGTIKDNNVIKGYYYFYYLEKVSRQNTAYEVVILNENLEEKGSERIIEPKTTVLLEASYNGNSILFKFFDRKSKTVSYRTMNNAGEMSSKETRSCNKYEAQIYGTSTIENINIQPVSSELFVDIHNIKDKEYKYSVEGIGNDGEVLWTYTPTNQMKIEMGNYLGSSENQVWIQVSKSKGIMSRDYTFDLAGISHDGEEDFRVPLQTKRYNLLAHSATYKKDKDEIVVVGEYYDISDKSLKSDSKGLFVKVISPEGDEISEDFISWTRDIGAMVSAEKKRELSKYYVYFHDILQTADGRILAVGEQYRKQVSATGMAFKTLAAASGGSTNASAAEIKIADVIVIELSTNYELTSVDIHEKKPRKVLLEAGYGTVSQHLLAKYLKASGWFDYQFTQTNKDNSTISFAYVDIEKVDGKMRRQAVLKFISYVSGEDDYTSDKLELTSEASDIWLMPAKPGYVLIAEYFKKEKAVDFRLEPINY